MSVVDGDMFNRCTAYSYEARDYVYIGLKKYNVGDTIVFVLSPSQQYAGWLEDLQNDKEFDIHYISPKAYNKNNSRRQKDQGNIVVIGTKKAVAGEN